LRHQLLLTARHHFPGVLQCLDGYMNIAMEQTEEHVNGVITNRYGDAFIRGNNGVHLWPLGFFHSVPDDALCLASLVYISRRAHLRAPICGTTTTYSYRLDSVVLRLLVLRDGDLDAVGAQPGDEVNRMPCS
jgi:LSM domain